MSSRIARTLLVGVTLWAPACHSWRVESRPTPERLADESPGRLRALLRGSGELVELEQPTVTADSIVGQVHGHRRAIALLDVESIELRRFDATRTTVMALGLAAASAVVIVALLIARDGGIPSS